MVGFAAHKHRSDLKCTSEKHSLGKRAHHFPLPTATTPFGRQRRRDPFETYLRLLDGGPASDKSAIESATAPSSRERELQLKLAALRRRLSGQWRIRIRWLPLRLSVEPLAAPMSTASFCVRLRHPSRLTLLGMKSQLPSMRPLTGRLWHTCLVPTLSFLPLHYYSCCVSPPLWPGCRGLRAFSTIYAGWGVGSEWYLDRHYQTAGFSSADAFVDKSYIPGFAECDASDLLAQVRPAMLSHHQFSRGSLLG